MVKIFTITPTVGCVLHRNGLTRPHNLHTVAARVVDIIDTSDLDVGVASTSLVPRPISRPIPFYSCQSSKVNVHVVG